MARSNPLGQVVHDGGLMAGIPRSRTAREPDLPAIGYAFRNEDLFHRSLEHPSVVGGNPIFECMEFLGDRVLGLVIAEMLLVRFPHESEGSIARRHTALVRQETLAEIGRAIGIDRWLAGQHAALGELGAEYDGVLSDLVEALIAALYKDGGLAAAADFIRRFWEPRLLAQREAPKDAKTRLQEWAQGKGLHLPRYLLTEREGPDHAPSFRVAAEVELGDGTLHRDEGTGPSKRTAEQEAAGKLLARLDRHG